MTHCMLYLQPLYCLLSLMLYHLLLDSCQMAIKPDLIVYFAKLLVEDFVAKLLALTSSYWLQIKNYFVKCLILDIVYILCYPTIEIVKQESHSGTADITTFYNTSRPTSSKTVFKQTFVFIHLVCILSGICFFVFLYFRLYVFVFMCLNEFTVTCFYLVLCVRLTCFLMKVTYLLTHLLTYKKLPARCDSVSNNTS